MMQEATYRLEELFYSYTDKKGLVLGGNAVFIRIAEFTEDELFQKPHNIIRHPDMPKTVFRLLWNYIKRDQIFVGYVKNKTKSGRYYWVLAMIIPVKDGYISIRLKPSSKFLAIIDTAYLELAKMERMQSTIDYDANTEWLMQKIKSHGYDSYEHFMKTILPVELDCRNKNIAGVFGNVKAETNDVLLARFCFADIQKFQDAIASLIKVGNILTKDLQGIKDLGSRMDSAFIKHVYTNPSVSTMAHNFNSQITQISTKTEDFQRQFSDFCRKSDMIHFGVSVMYLAIEMLNFKQDEHSRKGSGLFLDPQQSRHLFIEVIKEQISQIVSTIQSMSTMNQLILNILESFSSISSRLEIFCMTGKVTLSQQSSASVSELIDQLLAIKIYIESIKIKIQESINVLAEEEKQISKVLYTLNVLLRAY